MIGKNTGIKFSRREERNDGEENTSVKIDNGVLECIRYEPDTLLIELSSTTTSAPNDQISPQVYQSSQPYAPGSYYSVNQMNQNVPFMSSHQQ
ncbi:hypothetical protein BpHYR1_014502 [Brachionus plicatilis]|uniref:Uncharacterized protein n=1 Tax=Brachionus plicatilis TaxID=10195 RepID=A0A3M7QGC4_BRAPC|nr:hypothetical protein BpHYR1_014502 [Brachionus plicatilis]